MTTEIAESLTEVSAGTYRLRLPLPFPTQSVNGYIVRGQAGVDLVDTGEAIHAEYWAAAFQHLGIAPARVRQIYVTHHHSDHIGSARYLRSLSGAPVFVLDRDLAEARRSGPAAERHRTELVALLIRHGMPAELAEQWRAGLGPIRRPEEVPDLTALKDDQMVALGDDTYQVVWTPGHADGQYCLYSPARRLLFGADHLLQKLLPPLHQAPGRRPHLVVDYLSALERVAGLDVSLILPGHGAPFSDLAGHAQRMRHQLEQRLEQLLGHLKSPCTAFDLVPHFYPRVSRLEHQRYVLSDLITYLEHLVAQGRAVRQPGPPTDGGDRVWLFYR